VIDEVVTQLEEAGWNFESLLQGKSITVFTMNGLDTPTIHVHLAGGHHGPAPSWNLNYLVLTFLMNGQYYAYYKNNFIMMAYR